MIRCVALCHLRMYAALPKLRPLNVIENVLSGLVDTFAA
jgi:hypothetical protein